MRPSNPRSPCGFPSADLTACRHRADKFAGNIFSYGIGPSFDLYRSGNVRFAPVVELVGWHVLSGFQTGGTADAGGPISST